MRNVVPVAVARPGGSAVAAGPAAWVTRAAQPVPPAPIASTSRVAGVTATRERTSARVTRPAAPRGPVADGRRNRLIAFAFARKGARLSRRVQPGNGRNHRHPRVGADLYRPQEVAGARLGPGHDDPRGSQ